MSDVLIRQDGAALWLVLNRPERRNALNAAVLAQLSAGMAQGVSDPSIHALVISGAGDQAFCAGGDLAPGGGFGFDFAQPRTAYGDLLRQAAECPKPIIAAVNGACVAGGMGLLAMADMAWSVSGARFGLPEVKVGLFPMQVAALLQELVPQRVLRDWALTGRLFGAEEAQAAGVLNGIVADGNALRATVAGIVEQLAETSPAAVRRGKYALRAMAGMGADQAISFAESQLGLMTLTEDAQEGLAAFNAKRPPRFSGR